MFAVVLAARGVEGEAGGREGGGRGEGGEKGREGNEGEVAGEERERETD